MNTNTEAPADLRSRIAAFVAAITALRADYYARQYPNLTPDAISAEYVSDKWCKIVETRAGTTKGCRVYGFVCLADGETKALGKVKAGDIHKSASWKAPAKHARGSVFAADFGKCYGPHGIAYLRH